MSKKRVKLSPEQSAKIGREVKRLAESGLNDSEIGEILGISKSAVNQRRLKMRVPANPRFAHWTEGRVQFMVDNYHLGARYVSDNIGLSLGSVYSKAKHVGFLSCTDPWVDYEDEFIQSVINEAAEKLERKPKAIANRFLWLERGGDK